MEITNDSVRNAVCLATKWRRVVLKKLIVPQPVKKFSTTMFTATRKLSRPWVRWILLASSSFLRSIHISRLFPCLSGTAWILPTKSCILFLVPHTCYTPHLSHRSWFNRRANPGSTSWVGNINTPLERETPVSLAEHSLRTTGLFGQVIASFLSLNSCLYRRQRLRNCQWQGRQEHGVLVLGRCNWKRYGSYWSREMWIGS
jgi:hypothetical protein